VEIRTETPEEEDWNSLENESEISAEVNNLIIVFFGLSYKNTF
jgi:hypothetical protein